MAGSPVSFVAERETLVFESGSVDRAKGLVRNVRVVGQKSRNGRKYPLAVLEKHLALYAAPSYIGHHQHPVTGMPVDPPLADKFGRMVAPRVHNGGINADYQFNPEHPFAKPFAWACENDPSQYSFSPLKQVRWRNDGAGRPVPDADGDLVAESILQVLSVDVVDTGGTTASVFESFITPTWAAEMAAPDATKVAASLETDGAWIAFLTDLFAQMKGLAQSTKDTISALVSSAMANSTDATATAAGDGTNPATAAPAMESLRRMGPVGKWAAARLDAVFVAEAAKKREAWAADLIKAEGVPAALVSPVFVSMVAESHGNDARAKEIIADRKKLGGGARREPVTTDRAGLPSIQELVDGYVAG